MVKSIAGLAKARAALTPAARKKGRQSKITNNPFLIPGVTGNSTWVRRMKDLMQEHVQDMGGPDNVSAGERNLIRRVACMTVEAERLEQRFALAEIADPEAVDIYGRITGHLRRTLETLGLDRRARTVGTNKRQTLSDLMKTSHTAPVEIEGNATLPATEASEP
jgi:hypothetical protein